MIRGAPGDLSFIYAEQVTRLASYPRDHHNPAARPANRRCLYRDDAVRSLLQNRPRLQTPLPVWQILHGGAGSRLRPTPRQHQLGGYETWLGTNRLEVMASDKLLDNLIEMAKELHDGAK